MVQGIDVSKWQGVIDWPMVAKHTSFAAARATIGQSTKDEMFVQNYQGARAAGLVPGAYHVVAGDSTAEAQAANFKDSLTRAGYDKGLLVLDVELSNGATAAQILSRVNYLCNFIRIEYKRTPIIYTGHFWRDYLGNPNNNFDAKLWLAYYGADPTPWVPVAWDRWTIWQYTDRGTMPGITGNVDLDDYSSTLRNLKSLAGWEWDELATKDEIRTVVREELASLLTQDSTNADRVLTAVSSVDSTVKSVDTAVKAVDTVVRSVDTTVKSIDGTVKSTATEVTLAEGRLRAEILQNKAELTSSLSSLLRELETLKSDTSDEELQVLIMKLHRHLCVPCTADALPAPVIRH